MTKNFQIITSTIYDKKGNKIATATNSYTKTHPLQAKYAKACGMPHKSFLHSEILCLIRAKGKGYKLVIERFGRSGKPLLAKPCPICLMAIKESGIERIEYTV